MLQLLAQDLHTSRSKICTLAGLEHASTVFCLKIHPLRAECFCEHCLWFWSLTTALCVCCAECLPQLWIGHVTGMITGCRRTVFVFPCHAHMIRCDTAVSTTAFETDIQLGTAPSHLQLKGHCLIVDQQHRASHSPGPAHSLIHANQHSACHDHIVNMVC